MRRPSRSQSTLVALAIGALFTLLACLASTTRPLARLDRLGLDAGFRWLGTIQPDPRIVLIDIDDAALADMPEWPWPRRRFAQIVSTLHELGAKSIGLDFVFADASPPRLAGLDGVPIDVAADASGSMPDLTATTVIRDDDELRDAIRAAANVFVGVVAALEPPGVDVDGAIDDALTLLESSPDAPDAEVLRGFPPSMRQATALPTELRAARLLLVDFGLTESAIAEKLRDPALPVGVLPIAYPRAKRIAASRLARRYARSDTDDGHNGLFSQALPNAPLDARSPDRAALERAWWTEVAWQTSARDLPAVPADARPAIPTAFDVAAPLALIAEVVKGVGLVSYLPDSVDGRLRAVPLWSAARERVLAHLGYRIALDALEFDPAASLDRWGGDDSDDNLGMPIDERGETLINWTRPSEAEDWSDVFTHIPVTRLLELALNRETIRENDTRLGIAWAHLLKLRHADTPASYGDYVRLVNERLALRSQRGVDGADPGASADRLAVLDERIGAMESEALVWLRRAHSLWQGQEPQDDAERADRDRIAAAYASLAEGQLADRINGDNAMLTARSAALVGALRPAIANRICLVGYTASAQADLVATPVFERMPGVMAHANVINMVLQRRFVRGAGQTFNLMLIVLAGLLVTWQASRRGAVPSLMIALLVGVGVLGVGAALFRYTEMHVASFPALLGVVLPWGSVTVYRQLTAERARRAFERALSRYTSPAVAARIAERADVRDFTPRPAEVTCFFSDLQGFTRLSERLGPERTRDVLNPYLEGLTRVLSDRDALVNKFIGDGVFAFFNAPVLACPHHARAACESALAAVDCVAGLSRTTSAPAASERLIVRVGLATGPAFVGDYGSDTKLDYTCIGDTVNVASRLEQLNKPLGTSILVNESCRRAVGDAFAFRPIGLVRLAGREEAVSVFELRGARGERDEGTAQFDAAFGRLFEAFRAGDAPACRDALAECRVINPDDRVLGLYDDALKHLASDDSQGAWQGILELPSAR